jgi:uncharacterized protein YbaR (Trm112 family)
MPASDLTFDSSILDQLACPACLGDLRLEANQLLCQACSRFYPIVDGIPVLIAARASHFVSSATSST